MSFPNLARLRLRPFFALVLGLGLLFCFGATTASQATQGQDYEKREFTVDGRPCFLIEPQSVAEGRPWVWRARFPGYHSEVDQLLLAEGYHIAHMDTGGMLGSPAALVHWEAFYSLLTKDYDLNPRVALYGVSRGGLFVYRWAKNHPETVACIYNDTPVCDFKSWPGGRGRGKGDAATWANVLTQYGLDEEGALAYGDNPVDQLEPIAQAQIPIMHIVTEDDLIVPPLENTYVLRENLRSLGHSVFHVISLDHGEAAEGHHFALTHPQIGADFIRKYTDFGEEYPVYLRSGLQNSRHVFESTKKGRVAFLGGSITQMAGWRNHVAESLTSRFPDTEFDFVFAGIGSTDSSMGAFRLRQDIFARGQVDLLFIESAVNELHNDRTEVEMQRATEGIVLNARRLNPNVDLVAQYFFDPRYVDELRTGKTPWQIAALERIALQHGVNAVDQTQRCRTLFDTGAMSPEEFGGVHPKPAGHRVYGDMLEQLFQRAWSVPQARELVAHREAWIYDPLAFSRGHFQSIDTAQVVGGWNVEQDWQCTTGALRPMDQGATYLEAVAPGAELILEFNGTAIGLVMIAGPDVGVLEFRIDDGPVQTLDQFTRWSKGLHIPWIYMLASDLEEGEHTLSLTMADENNPESKGHASRLRYFAVNGPE
ncbi:MAG: sialidase-1 [Planctomycetota bacterium]|jgi:sialidase-1